VGLSTPTSLPLCTRARARLFLGDTEALDAKLPWMAFVSATALAGP